MGQKKENIMRTTDKTRLFLGGMALLLFASFAQAAPVQTAYLKALNAGEVDQFGSTVAIDGDTLVIGAPYEDADTEDPYLGFNEHDYGAVYVFVRDDAGSWSQQAYLRASNPDEEDLFGASVAISGNTLVVGAVGEAGDVNSDGSSIGSNNNRQNAGAVYVFTRTGSTWTQQAYLKSLSILSVGGMFGRSVAIEGDTVAVGAPFEGPDLFSIGEGAVHLFTRDINSIWSPHSTLKASNAAGDVDAFGGDVAISGHTIVVGASDEDGSYLSTAANPNEQSSGAGAAYVFVQNSATTSWSQQAYLKASNAAGSDQFGFAVDIDGDSIVVGAIDEDGSAASDGTLNGSDENTYSAGAAYVFKRVGGSWHQQAYLKAEDAEESDKFGTSVAISNNAIIVGAYAHANFADNTDTSSGAAYLFVRNGQAWAQQDILLSFEPSTGLDLFGASVAIENDVGVIGEPWEDSDINSTMANRNEDAASSGAVHVFKVDIPQVIIVAGDSDGDGDVDISDVIFTINLVLSGGVAVNGADCDESGGSVDINDVICAINKALG
jgi:hypothetical protein